MLKVVTAPGLRWPEARVGKYSSDLWNAYLELLRCEKQIWAEFHNSQEAQLVEMMRHCFHDVPYYRDRWKHGQPLGREALESYPILTRRDLAENLSQLTANRLPEGHAITGSSFTSGSTGEPVEVLNTNITQLWHSAMYLRNLDWGEFDSDGAFAAIRYYEPRVAKELQNGVTTPGPENRLAGLLKMSPSHIMDVHVDPERQLQWLMKVKPRYLVSYPSNLLALVEMHRAYDQKDQLKLDKVLSLSEALSADEEKLIAQSFSCDVNNSYSSHEVGYIAGQCRWSHAHSGSMHVFEENVVLEIVDDDGNACAPEQPGRVLLTTLQNYAMPLIRYDIGDVAAWSNPETCWCMRPHRLMRRPEGKRHPLFALPNGARKNSMALAAGMRKIGGMAQFRITQKAPTKILVEHVRNRDWHLGCAEQIKAMLHEFLESTDIQILFANYPLRLPLTASGKSPHLVTEVAPQQG